MPSCESCQTQLFPYVYDLLEPAERLDVDNHVHGCVHCQVELERTRARAGEVALAVKGGFNDVVFKTPKPTSHRPKPAFAAPRTPRRPLFMNRWVMAAACLVAVLSAGAVIAVSMASYQYTELNRAEDQLASANAALKQVTDEKDSHRRAVQTEIREIQVEIDKVIGDWNKKDAERSAGLKNQPVRFFIRGPRSIQPGAPNHYDIQVKPANPERPVQINKLRAQVVNDKTNAVLFESSLPAGPACKLLVPPNLPIKPGDDVALVLEADADGAPAQVKEHLTLLYPEYVTYLSTDRPMYRPGETLRFRSLTLERFSLQPASEDLNLRFRVSGANNQDLYKRDLSTRLGEKGQRVIGPDGQPLHGVGASEFALPVNLPGGVYTLSVSELNDRFAEEKRTFVVHRWQQPRFNKELEFGRSSYGPGEKVTVRGKVASLATGGAMGGAGMVLPNPGGPGAMPGGVGPPAFVKGFGDIRVVATAVVDSQTVFNNQQDADPDGSFAFEFQLPPAMANGVGTVTVEFHDGGNLETLVRPIPIVLRDIFVDLYPEGGDLVLGVPNRVYFQARAGASKPADVQGRVFERSVTEDKFAKQIPAKEAKEIARFQTLSDDKEPGLNQGLGSFTFTPQPKHRYELRIDAPAGITKIYQVVPPPAGAAYKVKADGVTLHLPEGVVVNDIPVILHNAGPARDLLVGAYCRGKLIDHLPVQARAGQKTEIVLHPAANAGGVYRVTVFEKKLEQGEARYLPLAERLLFRKQTTQLQVSCKPDREVYAPGDTAMLSFTARNEKREVVPAVAMIAVFDASVIKMAGDRTTRSMPTHFLLTTEIRQPEDLENTDALLGNHPRAAQALDLLLGAQGWRRFAEQDPVKFTNKAGAGRGKQHGGFLASAQVVPKVTATEEQARDALDQPFAGKFVSLQAELAQKERLEEGTPDVNQRWASTQNMRNQAQELVNEHRSRADDLWIFIRHGVLGIFAVAFVVFAFFLVASGLHSLAEGKRGYIFLSIGLMLLGFMFVVSVLGTFAMMGVSEDRIPRMFRNRNMMGGMAMKAAPPMMAQDVAVPGPWIGPPIAGVELQPGQDPFADDDVVQPGVGGPDKAPGGPPQVFPGAVIGDPFAGGFVPMMPDIRPRDPVDDAERQLRRAGRYQDILQQKLGRRVAVPAPIEPSAVREYAHVHKPNSGQVRRDFTETVCWQPALVLKDGTAQLKFDLSDAVTNFRVLMVSHTLDGRLGTDYVEIASRLPYSIEPKVPVEVASTDQITVPVVVNNSTSQKASGTIKSQVKGLTLLGEATGAFELAPGQTDRKLFRFQPNLTEGKATVRFQGKFDRGTDTVERSFLVVPAGFPGGEAFSGTVQDNLFASHEITMPDSWVRGSLTVQVQAFPSVLADLQKGLAAMLREPHGCFEQASSSNYPNVLILNYLQDSKQTSPAIEKQARALLDSGYQKLIAFECEPAPTDTLKVKHGYEWFGGAAPPHEALTAYGLLQFHDMARVYSVDPAMLKRTQQYLLDQRDAQGGFKRNPRAIDQFGRAPQNLSNAYIVWALTETGVRDELATELDTLYEQGKTSKDPYFIALASLGQLNAARTERGIELLKNLRGFQKEGGEVAGARTSITSSAGRNLLVETTALSTLGWLRAGKPAEFQASTQKAGKWLFTQRSGAGGFGSTQATVLALKALIAFTAESQRVPQQGDLFFSVVRDNGMNNQAHLQPGAVEPLTIKFQEKVGDDGNVPQILFESGKNSLQVRFSGNSPLPYTVSCSYRTLKPLSSAEAPVQLTTTLTKADGKIAGLFKEGQSVKLKATLDNKSGADQGMAIAVLGLPAGLALPDGHEQLKDLARLRDNGAKPGVISAWETNGRDLILYWRELDAGAKVELELDLVCRLPGVYTGPASRAYLYYNAEQKHWVTPLRASIDPAP